MALLFIVDSQAQLVSQHKAAQALASKSDLKVYFLVANHVNVLGKWDHVPEIVENGSPAQDKKSRSLSRVWRDFSISKLYPLSNKYLSGVGRLSERNWFLSKLLEIATCFLRDCLVVANRTINFISRLSWDNKMSVAERLRTGSSFRSNYSIYSMGNDYRLELNCLVFLPHSGISARVPRHLRLKIRALKISTFFFAEFNYFYGHLRLFALANKLGIKEFVYPFALIDDMEWKVTFSHQEARKRHFIFKYLMDRIFPDWGASIRGSRVRIPMRFAIQARFAGYKTHNPWLFGESSSILTLCPDTFTFEYLLRAGHSRSALKIVGIPDAEELIELIGGSRDFYFSPRLLIAIPPNQFGPANHEVYLQTIIEPLIKPALVKFGNSRTKVNLHPACSEEVRNYLSFYGVVISDRDISADIADTELFVAVSSSTLRIAELLGTYSIDYDLYSFGYKDYEQAKCVTVAKSPEEYQTALNGLSNFDSPGMDESLNLDFVQEVKLCIEN